MHAKIHIGILPLLPFEEPIEQFCSLQLQDPLCNLLRPTFMLEEGGVPGATNNFPKSTYETKNYHLLHLCFLRYCWASFGNEILLGLVWSMSIRACLIFLA